MNTTIMLMYLKSRLRAIISLILLTLGSVMPLILFELKSSIASFAQVYANLGARLPLPLRIFNALSINAIYSIWLVTAILIIGTLILEEVIAHKNRTHRSIPGLPELVAITVIALVIAVFIVEQPFISSCQDAFNQEEMRDLMIRHIQKYHQKPG